MNPHATGEGAVILKTVVLWHTTARVILVPCSEVMQAYVVPTFCITLHVDSPKDAPPKSLKATAC